MSRSSLEGVWKVSGRCLEGVHFLGPKFVKLQLELALELTMELTLFSHVTRRTRRTSPNFTLQEGFTGLYIREGERVGVRKVSGRCLEGIWKVSGRYLKGVWKVQIFWDPNF